MADAVQLLNADEAAAANLQQGANQQNQQNFEWFPFLKSIATRIFIFWLISTLIRNYFGGKQPQQDTTSVSSPSQQKIYPPSFNMFPAGQPFDLYIYLSPSAERFHDFDNPNSLFWKEEHLIYGDWSSGPEGDGTFSKSASFPTPPNLMNNGSIFMHTFIVKSGRSPRPRDPHYGGREVIHGSAQLNKYKKKHYRRSANLLTGETKQSEVEQQKADTMRFEVLNFWHPNITINLVADQTAWTRGQVPSPIDEAVRFDAVSGQYYPILFYNTYWNLGSEYQPINETTPITNLTVTYAPLSLFKWQLYASQQQRGKWAQLLGSDVMQEGDDDQDTIKQALLETNPILLGVTVVVSLLHTVLELLAFKNDIQFWRTRKSLEGLSVRTVLFNVFQSVVVFLYICDNDSSWVIKFSIGIGLLIEMWKIPKCINVEILYHDKLLGIVPKVRFSDKGSYVESETKAFDQMAYKYLSWALFPLLGCYAVYSLIYEEQRGWYSWVLSMMYSFLLTFGFIMMTPQLFINYKLKSVAHLPWRMLTYKFINTFIDDLFAFVIRMPTMYRHVQHPKKDFDYLNESDYEQQKLRDSQAMKEVIICYWCGEEKNAAKMLDHLRGGRGYGTCTGYHCTDGLSNEMRDVFSNPDIKAATAEEWAIHYPVEPGTKKGARVYAAVRKKGHITYVGSTINPKERAFANYNIDACEENLTIAEGIPEIAARAGEAFIITMADVSLLPKGKRRTKNQRFEFKNMVLPPAYEEKIRRQEMTFVQAHKAMRHLAYRLAKGMLSDDQLKLLKFSEWPTLEEMKAGRSTTLNDSSDEGEEDETADEKSVQNLTEETPTAQREQVEVARHDDAHSLSAAQDLLLEINMLTQATDPNDSIESTGMRGIELVEKATGITPKMKEVIIKGLRSASREKRRSDRAASAQSADRSNEGAARPVEEVSHQLNREDLGNRMSQGHESRKRKRMQEVLDDAGTTPKQSRLDGARMHANGGRGLEHRNEDSDVSLEEDEGGADSGDDYDSGDDGPDA